MKRILPALAVVATGCLEAPGDFRYGDDLTKLELKLTGPTMGVHPDTTILDVEQNPFADGVGADPRWDLVGAGFWIPAFYAWGSDLAMVPEGERQFYTALCAQNIYTLELADDADVVWTREIAIGGYQSMLDHFPEARSYDESGTFSWALAPLAIQGIQDLGGTVEGGWVLVEGADGELVAVQP